MATLKRLIKVGKQVVEEADVALFLALRQPLAVKRHHLRLQGQQPLVSGRLQTFAGVEERMRGSGAGGFGTACDA